MATTETYLLQCDIELKSLCTKLYLLSPWYFYKIKKQIQTNKQTKKTKKAIFHETFNIFLYLKLTLELRKNIYCLWNYIQNEAICAKKRLCNIFKTANAKMLIKAILESPDKVLHTPRKTTTLRQILPHFFKGRSISNYFLCLTCYDFNSLNPKVAII